MEAQQRDGRDSCLAPQSIFDTSQTEHQLALPTASRLEAPSHSIRHAMDNFTRKAELQVEFDTAGTWDDS